MKSNVAVMADEDTVIGFRLGGIKEGTNTGLYIRSFM